ncbi:MAG: C4-dicarboxylate ABC transporter [Hyphomicrobium sp.]|nr:C4-dicarboxylate ABC transporter [Hyphomicrobium sp.]PPD07323.1 MAG: C4-dicarboxylate ABC transporter [Hyphomicrobium sp.]
MRRAFVLFFATVLEAGFAMAEPPAAAEPIVIKFSHVAAPQAHKSKGAERFKALAEQYTGGRVRIELYPNSQLYKDKEELEALQLGAVEMLAPSLSKFGPLGIKAFEVFDIPFLFRDTTELARVTEGPIGKDILGQLEAKGIVGLGYWNNGFKILSANTPLKQPDDLLGLKVRIQSSRVIEDQMTALGALPQVLAFSEAYQALSSGVVDGTENPPANFYNQKMFEVQRHATMTNHGFLGYALIVNRDFWNGLPADIRTAIERAVREATPYANAEAARENDEAMEAMLKTGKTVFHTPSSDELAAWKAALMPVRARMAERVGADLVRRIEAELAGAAP